jgi:hypothetical protein
LNVDEMLNPLRNLHGSADFSVKNELAEAGIWDA